MQFLMSNFALKSKTLSSKHHVSETKRGKGARLAFGESIVAILLLCVVIVRVLKVDVIADDIGAHVVAVLVMVVVVVLRMVIMVMMFVCCILSMQS